MDRVHLSGRVSSVGYVDEWAGVKISLGVPEMDCGRRREWCIAILGGEIVGREKSGGQHYRVDRRKECGSTGEFLAMGEHGYSMRTRGSVAKSMTSAIKLPAIRNTAESITVPITT